MKDFPLKRLGSLTLSGLTALALAGCGSNDQTQFVLQSSGSASASASAPGASPAASETASTSSSPDTGAAATPMSTEPPSSAGARARASA